MSDREFERAKRKASWKRILSFVTGKPSLLLPFELVRSVIGMRSESYDGVREIDIDKVIGSVNRYQEFDREFLPRQWQTQERWSRVRRAFEEGPGFPPIKVYQMGNAFFVSDGNHRLSVARQLGIRRIEAEVTKLVPSVPIDEHTDIASLIVKAEYSDFLKATRLGRLRPGSRIEFTRTGRYAVLLEHIEKHRYFLGLERECAVSYEDAVVSWYDTLYLPLVEIFRQERMLDGFPRRTEADLYVWATKHLFFLRDRFGDDVGLDEAARDFAREYRMPRLLRLFQKASGRVARPHPRADRKEKTVNALELVATRLSEMAAPGRSPAGGYRVPRIWIDPMDRSGETEDTDPTTFWVGAIDRVLSRPPKTIPERPSSEWTARAKVYNLFIRAAAAFDHDGDGMIQPLNRDGLRETGTFLKAIALLPYIRSLGCNTLHLLPVYAIGEDGRKGRLGSPYAVRDPFALDETLSEPSAGLGPDLEFHALVQAAHRLGLRVVVEFVFRTAAKDSAWVAEHPEWFYWIHESIPDRPAGSLDEAAYGSPLFSDAELTEIRRRVAAGRMAGLPTPHPVYRRMFVPAPAPRRVQRTDCGWRGTTPGGATCRVPGAFADWPPDDTQPPWDDVTYLRLYGDPAFDYMSYNTVRMYDARLAVPENAVRPLWERITRILPHYRETYGVDGVMIDMGHALPQPLKDEMVAAVRRMAPGFAFWDEDFSMERRQPDEVNDAVIGNLWWAVHRPADLKEELLPMLSSRGTALPFFATPETHNTPRCAARRGGAERSAFAWTFGTFLPAMPFVHAGFEWAETDPVNTGLDFTPEEAAAVPVDRLGLYSPVAYAWSGTQRLVALIRETLRVRDEFEDLLIDRDPRTFHALEIEDGPALGYVRKRDGLGLAVIGNPTPCPVDAVFYLAPWPDGPVEAILGTGRLVTQSGRCTISLAPWTCCVFRLTPEAPGAGQ